MKKHELVYKYFPKLLTVKPPLLQSIVINLFGFSKAAQTLHEFDSIEPLTENNMRKLLHTLNIQDIRVHGLDHLSKDRRYLFVSNHPFPLVDTLMIFLAGTYTERKTIGIASDRSPKRRPDRFKTITIWDGTITKDEARNLAKAMRSENNITMFPSGTSSKPHWKNPFTVKDPPWKNTYLKFAIKYKRDIVPIHITARYSILYYTLSSIRRLLQIKVPYEALLRPRESYRKRKCVEAVVHKPIDYRTIPLKENDSLSKKIYNFCNFT